MIEELEMENVQDSFTLSDRRELIRQGLQLENMQQDLIDIKVLVNDTTSRDSYEKRLRKVEDDLLSQQSKAKAYIAIASVLGSGMSVLISFIIEWFKHG